MVDALTVTVGIVSGKDLRFTLNGGYVVDDDGTYRPTGADSTFTLHDVTIGKNFHWQRRTEQTFSGALRFVDNGDGTRTAVNILPVEDYLVSVISSEMSPDAPMEFLKAHAVVSRSWLLRIIAGRGKTRPAAGTTHKRAAAEGEHIRWYDRDDHELFDVCADDHCQRYQGIVPQAGHRAADAVRATCGEVLTYGGEICDARFSKCCGGRTEVFSCCWDDEDKPYLVSVSDTPEGGGRPFCDTDDAAVIKQVMKSYDRETKDFFRWTVSYSREQLGDIVRSKLSGGRDRSRPLPDLGTIEDLVPVERGKSGRIRLLRIKGSKGEVTVGKELEIRRVLSPSHLYSSAFTVERTADGFTLHGRGWGHGVGLCQIGAAVMGSRGYSYDAILLHYYRGATITKLY